MKNKLYKIRNVRNTIASEENMRGVGSVGSNSLEGLNTIAEVTPDRDSQFSQILSMFQTFMKSSEVKESHVSKSY
jgi:hypothetical protein